MKRSLLCLAALSASGMTVSTAAYSVQGSTRDLPGCDPLPVMSIYEELGTAPAFNAYPEELILASAQLTSLVACSASTPDSDPTNDWLVTMTNLTGRAIDDPILFVVDANGSMCNIDGEATDTTGQWSKAFVIDAVGVNQPLFSESLIVDGIFQPNEVWEFIVNDFAAVPGGAPAFSSLGFAYGSPGGGSNASIVVAVPAPMAAGLGLAPLAALSLRRRR